MGSVPVPKAAAASLLVVAICALLGLSRLDAAQAAIPEHLVRALPGQPPVNFTQYAGYVNVDAANGRNIFYWFTQADSKQAASLPLAFWFNGGKIMLNPLASHAQAAHFVVRKRRFRSKRSELGKRIEISHMCLPNLLSELVFVFKVGGSFFFFLSILVG